jgi:hypothetical protein
MKSSRQSAAVMFFNVFPNPACVETHAGSGTLYLLSSAQPRTKIWTRMFNDRVSDLGCSHQLQIRAVRLGDTFAGAVLRLSGLGVEFYILL